MEMTASSRPNVPFIKDIFQLGLHSESGKRSNPGKSSWIGRISLFVYECSCFGSGTNVMRN